MKILYIAFVGDLNKNKSGVAKKVIDKISTINELGYDCDGLSLSNQIGETYKFNEHITVLKFVSKEHKYFRVFWERYYLYKSLIAWLTLNISKYKFIIFRFPTSSYGLLKLVKKFPNKIVFEHNAVENSEIKLRTSQLWEKTLFSFKPGFFIFGIECFFSYYREEIFGKSILKKALMGIAVTNEIKQYEVSRYSNYYLEVISNSVNVEELSIRKTKVFNNNDELKLFMLLGNDAPWHGVERIVESFNAYKGINNLTIDVIGGKNDNAKILVKDYRLENKVRFINDVNGDDLTNLVDNYHVGVGTFALYLKGLAEASSLKVREYFGRGFPVILAYSDTDLMGNSDFSPYYLEFKNNNDLIDLDKIFVFVKQVYSDTNHPQKIRDLSLKYMDTKQKTNLMLKSIVSHV